MSYAPPLPWLSTLHAAFYEQKQYTALTRPCVCTSSSGTTERKPPVLYKQPSLGYSLTETDNRLREGGQIWLGLRKCLLLK